VALLVAAAASRAAEVAVEVSPETIAAVEGSVTRVTRTAYPKFFLTYTPDGTGLCYTRHHANRRAAGLVLMSLRRLNVDGSDDRPLLTAFDAAVQIQEHAAFSPDGQTLLVTGGGNDTGNAAKDVFTATISATGEVGDLRKVIPGPSVNVGEQPAALVELGLELTRTPAGVAEQQVEVGAVLARVEADNHEGEQP
jgi:hypothetical protein